MPDKEDRLRLGRDALSMYLRASEYSDVLLRLLLEKQESQSSIPVSDALFTPHEDGLIKSLYDAVRELGIVLVETDSSSTAVSPCS